MFQFDLGQIGTLTPSPCSNPVPIWDTNPVPLYHTGHLSGFSTNLGDFYGGKIG
ncbi:MAG: hypothetical protein FWE41_06300 [Coriobacteriia bacterium]|nr:hypothetical protein [Coriobacteriia bacterium]